MSDTSRFLTALGRVLRAIVSPSSTRSSTASAPSGAGRSSQGSDASRPTPFAGEEASPGQFGDDATIEIDADRLRGVELSYAPTPDGDPDPGEVVWTWVPFEERDGRGKDRPVVIVAASQAGDYLAVQLTSKAHDGDRDYVSLGEGPWDASGRPSWAKIDRVFRVRAGGVRREAASLDERRFDLVAGALSQRYGWR
ncbi:type II toxin-antitoxin system PemK/MazF family toxin [Agromyces lapidis]|uniref:Type II toxin-antitoxin system PemK/MazF family toxin n=1 Tax=Agromyces lapidis TaxID=279574 RepID=A0ABV5SRS9_9MICO|nr:type II toxin-antitoxin system PemK/MazF family toxin [Agromyces lapidis]